MLSKTDLIDKTTPIPLYFQLKELILSEINSGNYKPGDMLPTENEISQFFQISRTTVRQAITELVQEGWVYRMKSKGTFVSMPKITQDYIKKIKSFNDEIRDAGMIPSTEVIEFFKLSSSKISPSVADALQLSPGEPVVYLHRKRMANDDPIVTLKTYLPYNLCAYVLNHDLTQEKLYDILAEKYETKIFRIERTVEAMEATAEDIHLLNMSRKHPIQFFTSIGYNCFDAPIEYSLARYRGDRNKFKVTVFPKE